MWRYLKAAFWVRPRIPGLGAVPVNALAAIAFGIFGFVNAGFWLLGLAAVGGFTVMLASHRGFQRHVKRQEFQRERIRAEEQMALLVQQLEMPFREKLGALRSKCAKVLQYQREGQTEEALVDQNREALRKLEWAYLKLLTAQQHLREQKSEVDDRGLRKQIAQIEEEMRNETLGPAIKESKAATLEILRRRLALNERREETLREIASDLTRIEAQVDLVLENAAIQGQPQSVSTNIKFASQLLDGGVAFGDAAEAVALVDNSFGEPPLTATRAPEPVGQKSA